MPRKKLCDRQPLVVHERGALFTEIRGTGAFRAAGHRSFHVFCAALSQQHPSASYARARTAMEIYEGFTVEELTPSRASIRVLTALLGARDGLGEVCVEAK